MSDDLYCKLYLACDDPWSEANAIVADEATGAFVQLAGSTVVYRNEGFRLHRLGAYDCIEDARYYVEVDADEEPPERRADFISAVVSLVTSLRARGWIVTVSSDFEDEIVERTGWNWTREAPNPPGWSRS